VDRQFAAGISLGDRRDQLRRLKVPTVVLHGESDPLIPIANGREQAETIPGAELIVIPGLGHEMPSAASLEFADAITRAATRAKDAR
jgi:pimeloyl-ACP methyl ester carboxylesterase